MRGGMFKYDFGLQRFAGPVVCHIPSDNSEVAFAHRIPAN